MKQINMLSITLDNINRDYIDHIHTITTILSKNKEADRTIHHGAWLGIDRIIYPNLFMIDNKQTKRNTYWSQKKWW